LIGEDRKSFEQHNNYSSPSAGNLEIRGAKAWEDAGNCAAKKYGTERNLMKSQTPKHELLHSTCDTSTQKKVGERSFGIGCIGRALRLGLL
jgi:hypothetical protein